MNKSALILFLLCIKFQTLSSQDKRGNTFIFGGGGIYATCTDTSKPLTGRLFTPPNNYSFLTSASNICDSATGQLLMLSQGMVLYDTSGNIIENGDTLVPSKMYNHNGYPSGWCTQGSLILPKGSNGLYYIFTPAITDSNYDYYVVGNQNKVPFDLLQYHIVDMNANGGMGKLIQKNMSLLTNVEMAKVGMMACKHANGYDWWLLKQALDTNMVYTFLVTKDTVLLDTIQGFAEPHFGYYDLWGQSCFSNDGSKYAFATGGGYLNNKGAHLFITDFDRCYGILSNIKEIYVPYDSSLTPNDIIFGPYSDSLITGVCFSPNDSFLYVSRRYNLYQFDINQQDTSLSWKLIQHGPDTLYSIFSHMLYGADNRIYIGHQGCSPSSQLSVIDSPNNKGSASNYCKLCTRYDPGPCTSSPSNMPNFNMPKKEPCWPLGSMLVAVENKQLEVYPNPSSTVFYIKNRNGMKKELYTMLGELLYTTTKNEIDVKHFTKGVYYLRCLPVGQTGENEVRKVIIE